MILLHHGSHVLHISFMNSTHLPREQSISFLKKIFCGLSTHTYFKQKQEVKPHQQPFAMVLRTGVNNAAPHFGLGLIISNSVHCPTSHAYIWYTAHVHYVLNKHFTKL